MNGIEETGFIVIVCSRTPITALKQVKNAHRYFYRIHMTVQRACTALARIYRVEKTSIIVIVVAVKSEQKLVRKRSRRTDRLTERIRKAFFGFFSV